MKAKNAWLLSFILALPNCATVTVPDTNVCATAGVMGAGADCVTTNTNKSYSMTPEAWIDFLEPRDDRGAALCLAPDEWAKIKTAIEQACLILGSRCSYSLDGFSP